MATFEVQIEGMTGLTIDGTSNPTQDELTEYLKDGVIDVTSRVITLKPEEASLFTDVTALQVAQSANLNGAKIISVLRADGVTAENFRPCRKISPDLEYLVTDINSLNYASKFNPAFLETEDGKINVYPAPSDNSGKDSYKVYYVNNSPQNASGSALASTHSDIKSFPNDKVYLVVTYASMKALQNAMAGLRDDFPSNLASPVLADVTETLPIFTAPAPIVLPPSLTEADIDFSSIGSVVSFSSPVMSLPAAPSDLSIGATIPVAPTIDLNTIGASSMLGASTAPVYTKPTMALPPAPGIDDLSISAIIPAVPAGPSIAYSTASVGDGVATAQDAITVAVDSIAEAQDAITAGPSDASGTSDTDAPSDASGIDVSAAPSDASGTTDTEAPSDATGSSDSAYSSPSNIIIDTQMAAVSGEEAPLGTDAVFDDFAHWFQIVGEYIEDEEDTELAMAQLEKIKTYCRTMDAEVGDRRAAMEATINDARFATEASIANAQNDVSTNNTSMQTLVQASIANARNDADVKVASINSQTQASIANANADVSTNNASMQTLVQASIANAKNDLDASLGKMVQSTNAAIAKMQQSTSASTTKMIQSTTAAIAKMRESTNVNLQNAAKVLEAMIADYGARIQLFQGELSRYEQNVNKQVAEYKQNVDKNIAIWTQKNGTAIAQYQADIQNELNNFNEMNAIYQAQLQESLQNAQLAEGEEGRKLQGYQSEIQKYQAEVNKEVTEYQSNYTKWKAQRDTDLQKYATDVQNATSVFGSDMKEYEVAIQKH